MLSTSRLSALLPEPCDRKVARAVKALIDATQVSYDFYFA